MELDYHEVLVRAVCRLICEDEDDYEDEKEYEDKATAFLVAKNKVITATHTIKNYYEEGTTIYLQFRNIDSTPVERTAIPIKTSNEQDVITILELNEPVETNYLSFIEYEPEKNYMYETYGYPVVKWSSGQPIDGLISRKVEENMTNNFDWDLDLDVRNSKIDNFAGLSGSPLLVNGRLAGVIITQAVAKKKAISLGAISLSKIKTILENGGLEVLVDAQDTRSEIQVIRDVENVNYENHIFIAMLESANIFDHELCQEEFFNAEIKREEVDSKEFENEVLNYYNLRKKVHSIWKTKHYSYQNEDDGYLLLSEVNERIEDLDNTVLKSDYDINIFIKKGMLHQLSEQLKVGWVKNYSTKLQEYLQNKDAENAD
ncbi:hypothetical protein PAECIP111891_02730 [Paenibacillus allorhizoplanae]|uniref:Trypsin-like peptidase domain-containing protein n=1 Tax=Paenibacillus allorhizoplanae TaxID=2905648 RepID=A0ABM9C6I9_9BACL|nr:hypothetical protein [Paenibacillus allorhizoplanae]CAH1205354.1 hypothetical protein PAECIP111891_02730 [Paenibacillus allorhizoplanae]